MCKGLIAKKRGMTRIFTPDGICLPVTVVQVGPCVVTQIKTELTDGYNALQLGFGEKKESRTNKPTKGHLEKSGLKSAKVLREMSVENPDEYSLGQEISLDIFKIGDFVDVAGISKGRGFSGVIKRHGFHRGPMGHGGHSKRTPGSVGMCAWPAKILKGKKMPGHYGQSKNTIRNLEIVDIRSDQNLILLKGAVPGARSGILSILKK
ncbi:MAG: 50S ribosomal protein L3 [Desulfobacterales bacterium]|nr:50S ribosomal protein L3 [Desulfobacterales bacterium]MDD4070810.1 50S ribosomal protein L3 [Desulfobacterales bacterium]MDD4391212.1 50S ribosomal protein L3 [Desulfobacterales bacterium]